MFAAGYTLEKADHSKDFEEMASLDEAISVLRPIRREQVEDLRGTWIWYGEEVHCTAGNFPIKKCTCCKREILLDDYDNFCPNCGAPMVEEAVQMVMERLEKIKDGKID